MQLLWTILKYWAAVSLILLSAGCGVLAAFGIPGNGIPNRFFEIALWLALGALVVAPAGGIAALILFRNHHPAAPVVLWASVLYGPTGIFLMVLGMTWSEGGLRAAIKGFGELCVLLVVPERESIPFDDRRDVALARAAARGEAKAVRAAVEEGANVNSVGRDGTTPLLWAVEKGSAEGVRALVELGADPAHRSKAGASAIDLAVQRGACECVRVLLDAGVDPDTANVMGVPVLFTAVECKRWDCMRLLLERGADRSRVDREGRTLLCAVALQARFDIVVELIEQNADVAADRLGGRELAWTLQASGTESGSEQARHREKALELLRARGIELHTDLPHELQARLDAGERE